MRRIERLINLVAALLETRRPLTAEEIRAQIAGYNQDSHEAFRRAFERDKEALRDMGIPLELRRADSPGEPVEGYIIPKDRYYLPELDLEPDELAALKLAGETGLGRSDDAGTGLLKLTLEPAAGSWAAPQVIAGANVAVEDPHLGTLYSALLAKQPVAFAYEDAQGRHTRRQVEPWALVHRAGYWYLVGRDVGAGDRRTFKLSRIGGAVEILEGSYGIPEGIDAGGTVGGEAWEFGASDVAEARVRFAPSARWWAEQNLTHLRSEEGPGGALDIDLPVGNDDALLGWLIGWGGMVSIVSPEELRRRLLEHLSPWLDEVPV